MSGSVWSPSAPSSPVEQLNLQEQVDDVTTAVTTHISDPVGAHAASAIAYAGSSNLSATTVEAALDELDSEKEPANAALVKSDESNSWTEKQIFANTVKMQQVLSKITIGSGLASSQQFDVLTQGELYFSVLVAANWTLNVRGNSTTPLANVLAIGESTTLRLMIINGATPYYCTAFTIDGVAVTPRWLNGAAPSGGVPGCINIYEYRIIRTGSSSYIVLASFSSVDNRYLPKPLAACATGVQDTFKSIPANVPTRVRWGQIYFDDDPNRVPGTTSGILVIAGSGSDALNGNIFLRRRGKYRINAQVYYEPPQSGTEVSAYARIINAGTNGLGTTMVAASNDEIPQGEHPSVCIDRIILNEVANTYYYIDTYYFPTVTNTPPTLNLQTDGVYCWVDIKFEGEL